VKAGARANRRQLLLQLGTARQLHLLQLLDRGEMLIDEDRIGQGPEVLGWLELGRIGRQKQQVHVLRHPQTHTGVPARPVEYQHNLLAGTGSGCASKSRQLRFKEGNRDAGGQMKDGAARGGMDKADDVAPGKAVLNNGYRSLANRRPHPQHAPV
jgi:hypothetical protein